jgi:hypothetical protein
MSSTAPADRSRHDSDGWFQNLAGATYSQGRWQTSDPTAVQLMAAKQLEEAMSNIESLAVVGAEAFNWKAPTDRCIRVLHLTPPTEKTAAAGIVILQQGTQLRLEYRPYRMEAILVAHFGFERESRPLRTFLPQVDPHGAVVWVDQAGQTYAVDQLVRTLFGDLVRTNFEIQALQSTGKNITEHDRSK